MSMTKKQLLLATLTLFMTVFSLSGLFGQGQENQIIERIDIEFISPSSAPAPVQLIRSRLKTREGDIFSQSAFDNDLKMLAQEYDRVEPLLETTNGRIAITLKLWPKPVINDICWSGNRKMKTKWLQSELGVAQGSVFDRQGFNQAFHNVKNYYVKQGFFEAQLDYFVDYDEQANQVDITICIEEGRAGKIKQIVFCNFDKCEENELLEMMVTKEYNFFLSWLTGEGIYNDEMIQHDEFIILNYLQNQGYADAKVDIDICEAKQNNRIILYITADRGERYYFGNVTIEGNTLFTDEELLDCIKAKPGCPFSPENIARSAEILTNRYGRCGYIEAFINYEPKLQEHSCAYDVHFTVDEGEQYHVGMIKVMGNCSTQTKVILHETLLIPGEVFDLQKLKITEARLCNIGYFKNVNVYAVKSESHSVLPGNYRDVHIEVEEANTGHLGAFFGFSTVENMFGGINLTERNFNARGLCRFWNEGFRALRGGGEYAHITLSLGSKTSTYALSWTKPYFNDTKWSVGFDLEKSYNCYIADDYEINTYALTLHASYQYNPYVRVGTHYRIKYGDIDIDDHDDDCDDKKNDNDKNHCKDKCKELKEAARNDGLISALGMTWQYNSTDHPLKPTCGYKSRIEGEIAGLGGDRSFLSVGYLNSYYWNMWDFAVLKMRGDLRFIQPLGSTGPDDIPLDERFFLGGDCDIRGYRAYRLGPKFCKDKEDPKGGISVQLFSLEASKELLSCADGFLFFDTGSISMKKWNFSRFYHSAGFGARVKIFEGTPPLTIGMGFPINPRHSSDVKRFFISVGGKF